MPETIPRENSLVLYKNHPARVLHVADKLEIELAGSKTKRVRPKDVILLHPGPLHSLGELTPRSGDVQEAWELLSGETTQLAELAELIFGAHTPGTTWAAWQLVTEGLYFHGTPDNVEVRFPQDVERERTARETKAAAERSWSEFLKRLGARKILPQDKKQLSDAEMLALARHPTSRVLRELGREETPANAHALLLKVGYWDETVNPYPRRFDVPTEPPALQLPNLPEEDRLDLTHLPAFAIDDEDNQDPDDALSLDGDRLWVHVADVAALVRPESPLDLEACARGANLYLPELISPMLPPAATEILGLGLNEVSPALSFGLTLNADAEITDIEIVPSWVKVTRLSYAEAEHRLEEALFRRLHELAQTFREQRKTRDAASIDLPEVKIRVQDGEVVIHSLARLKSRDLVTEAMLMAGVAAARFAQEHGIPFPFATQAPPEVIEKPAGLAAMYAYRKRLKPSQMKSAAEPHAGLGLEVYTRATSPLRRYPDLVAHQQLRAYLRGEQLLGPADIATRVGAADAVSANIRRAERLSKRHWTLVYLLKHPGWRGEGILVEQRGPRGTVIIPQLGLDAQVRLNGEPLLDSVIQLNLTGVELPELSVRFRT